MPVCEYQCMTCRSVFSMNVSDRENSNTENPKITCPHCGAEHAHVVASAGCAESGKN